MKPGEAAQQRYYLWIIERRSMIFAAHYLSCGEEPGQRAAAGRGGEGRGEGDSCGLHDSCLGFRSTLSMRRERGQLQDLLAPSHLQILYKYNEGQPDCTQPAWFSVQLARSREDWSSCTQSPAKFVQFKREATHWVKNIQITKFRWLQD